MEKSDRLLCVLFGVILAAFFLAGLFKPQKGFSEFENRYLSRKPELSAKGILSGEYMKKYEAYVTDQFPFRKQSCRQRIRSGLRILSAGRKG